MWPCREHGTVRPRAQGPAAPASAPKLVCRVPRELEDELRRAAEDFGRGDYIEVTVERLNRCVTTGESPWTDESRG
jgi:hypothetical protein